MNRRSLIIAAILAVISMIAGYSFIQNVIQNRIGDYDEQDIVVALQEIPQNTIITGQMIGIQKVPKRFIQPSATRDIAFVEKKMAVVPIPKSSQILKEMVVPPEEGNIALSRIPPGGFRAVTIGVRDGQGVVSVGGLVRAGNFVDILLTLFYNTQTSPEKNQALGGNRVLTAEVRTLFQNVRVLAIGTDFELKGSAIQRSVDDPTRNDQDPIASVTVALRPRDVQKLVLAQTVGRLTLSLRRYQDDALVELPIEDAVTAFNAKLPIEQGPIPFYRDIQGGTVLRSGF